MIFTIVILLLLLTAIMRGFHRGLVIEILHLVGTIAVLIFARLVYQPFGSMLSTLLSQLKLIDVSTGSTLVINLVAFFILTSLGWAVVRMLARLSRSITWLPVIKQVNSVAGGAVSFIIAYLVIFVVLSLANLVNTDFIQTQMSSSPVATFIVNKTPGLTSQSLSKIFKFETSTQNS
ncbi:CvpA family protein [Lactiplantibacillus sp. WILCCON 0030]|uniref:CvpA family protein n=1 Tax=Lactiplantibacillus brownii TaxID=3069269 RepID=A0ABU1ADI8_9LACO|nr:CvpA family protein [Lactiplantibacillus brownii]MDQ7938497.1 CvpA family protein [Lactiplantibacillus brownii]